MNKQKGTTDQNSATQEPVCILLPTEKIVYLSSIVIHYVVQDEATGKHTMREMSLSDHEPPDTDI